MSQVGTQRPRGIRARDRMAVDASRSQKGLLSLLLDAAYFGLHTRCSFTAQPIIEIVRFLCDDQQRHMSVLHTAELCALTAVRAGLIRFERNRIGLPWDQVDLAMQLRNPEAMNDIRRGHMYDYGLPDRDVDFISSRKLLICITDFPP